MLLSDLNALGGTPLSPRAFSFAKFVVHFLISSHKNMGIKFFHHVYLLNVVYHGTINGSMIFEKPIIMWAKYGSIFCIGCHQIPITQANPHGGRRGMMTFVFSINYISTVALLLGIESHGVYFVLFVEIPRCCCKYYDTRLFHLQST